MADKNFFDLLKDKMATLRPNEQHRTEDWDILGQRLDTALPPPPPTRRHSILLPFLLPVALVCSNAVWWQSNQHKNLKFNQLEQQISELNTTLSRLPQQIVRTDTIWQTVYVDLNQAENLQYDHPYYAGSADIVRKESTPFTRSTAALQNAAFPSGIIAIKDIRAAAGTLLMRSNTAPDTLRQFSSVPFLAALRLTSLTRPQPAIALPEIDMRRTPEKVGDITALSQKMIQALRPKYYKIGVSTGWLYAASSSLMHEGGVAVGLRGEIGFTRHWSLNGNFSLGQIHYKAHDPAAILGSPVVPVPGYGEHFSELEVTGQKIRQLDVGLRYTFAQPGRPRPFLGFNWGNQTILPFRINYETEHGPSGIIQRGSYDVTIRTRLRNLCTVNAGLELPLSPRFNLTLEGYYQRAFHKSTAAAPDLTGIRGGVNWLF